MASHMYTITMFKPDGWYDELYHDDMVYDLGIYVQVNIMFLLLYETHWYAYITHTSTTRYTEKDAQLQELITDHHNEPQRHGEDVRYDYLK